MSAIPAAITAVILLLPLPLAAATTVVKGTDPTKQLLRGPIVTPNGSVLQGEVVIEGDTITCVAADCPDPPGASVFTVTDAIFDELRVAQQVNEESGKVRFRQLIGCR